jgi:magnesium-protoporphyrin O-methyltransferase
MFDAGAARSDARAYRKKGLDPTAGWIVAFLKARGLDGQTVLEVGGGVGAIQVELLRAGAARAVNVELSSGYEAAARALIAEAGLDGRIERRVMDFAREARTVAPADLVLLHRVVCCYPDMQALVGAAAARAHRYLALSFPPDAWWARLGLWAENRWRALTHDDFRACFHPPADILAVVEAQGLRIARQRRRGFWHAVVFEREGASAGASTKLPAPECCP